MTFYTPHQRELQDRFDSRKLADRLQQTIITDTIQPEQHQPFIESRDFFFLSTVSERGEPTVSHKGGGVGLVTVVDPKTLIFPSYDGNGMFMSMGNIAATAKIGMLFMDFESPHRIRVQATATVSGNDPLITVYPGAQLLVRAHVDQVFINCARLIHTYQRVGTSKYVPDASGHTPFASWKRIDAMQDVLPASDQGRASKEGGLITINEYSHKVQNGES